MSRWEGAIITDKEHWSDIFRGIFLSSPNSILKLKHERNDSNKVSSLQIFNSRKFYNTYQKIVALMISQCSCCLHLTPPNFRVCAQRKVPAKRFKICHILCMRKPKVAFSVFHFVLTLYFYVMNALFYCRHRPRKHKVLERNERKEKSSLDTFWSVLLEFFVEHKLWNWEEWDVHRFFLAALMLQVRLLWWSI